MAINKEFIPLKLAVAVDTVVFGYSEGELFVLLIERGLAPFKGGWALPGGFIRDHEDLETAAYRELSEETGLKVEHLEQLYSFGAPDRDPRYRVVSIAYFALVRVEGQQLQANTDAQNVRWFSVAKMPKLAFDHAQIIEQALKRLRAKVRYEPLAFSLLPKDFTLFQLQQFFEAILGQPLDKRNFRAKILKYGFLKKGRKLRNVKFRSPQLYQFEPTKYKRLQKRGVFFDI